MNNIFSTVEESINDLFNFSAPKDPDTILVSANSHEGTVGYLTNYRFKNIRDVGSYFINQKNIDIAKKIMNNMYIKYIYNNSS